MSDKERDPDWRWQMPTDRTVVRMVVPDTDVECRVLIQGTDDGWTKVIRIDLGVELIADVPVPEDTRQLLRPRAEIPAMTEDHAVAAVRAAFRELATYDATRAVKEITRSASIGDDKRTGPTRELTGDLRLAAVAAVYRELVEVRGITRYSHHLAKEFAVSPQRAKELVEEARAAGFLGPARPGAAGEVRKPRKKQAKEKKQ